MSAPAASADRLVEPSSLTTVEHGIRGGALYDALVAATAAHHRHTLVTAYRRAALTYQALGVTVTYVGEP